uniref:Rhodopsin domain-containing protein n=1 Tax=Coccidioides posadasii RMSCC 3488 TaxID=454284 RepID=A0A0J6ETM0_COCPO|nr:hypothetical protein CPAG_00215 [Coccidioides posadasii RMSCC 3488]
MMVVTGPPPDGDVNRGNAITIIMWVEFSIALVLILSRIFSRARLNRSWGWDDTFMCFAMVNATAQSVLLTLSVSHGTGRHEYYLIEYDRMLANKFNWISQGLHVMSTNWGKVSVTLFLLRMVDRAKEQRKAFYGGMVLLTIVNVLCIYSLYRQCDPTPLLWDSSVEGTCWNPSIQRSYAIFQGSFSAFSDLLLAIYPIFILWKSRTELKLKIGLGCVTALGIVAMIAAIIRTIFVSLISKRDDYTFHSIPLALCITTEQYLIIIAASIPTLGPLVNALLKRTSCSSPNRCSHPLSRISGRPNHERSRGGRNRSRSGKMILTSTNAQVYPLSEYKGWIGPNGINGSGGSDEAILPSQNIEPGCIMKTMEIRVSSRDDDRSESDISLSPESSNEV